MLLELLGGFVKEVFKRRILLFKSLMMPSGILFRDMLNKLAF